MSETINSLSGHADLSSEVEAMMSEMDEWAAKTEAQDGAWVPADYVYDHGRPLFHGIQQVRSELKELAQIFLDKYRGGTILEIGLGQNGGTRVLWDKIFSKVMTIEISHDLCVKFLDKNKIMENGALIVGNSADPKIINIVFEKIEKCDALFIDGDHKYSSVVLDWANYSPLVVDGGVVAFHDTGAPHVEVMQAGRFMSTLRAIAPSNKIIDIHHSAGVGISYYINNKTSDDCA